MEQEPQQELTEVDKAFEELYGIPLLWAKQLAQFDNEIGEYWKNLFKYLKEQEEYDRREST